MSIITISREFGSGGRELGKRVADLLGFAYYDKEIMAAIAHENNLNETYVQEVMDKGFRTYPITIGHTFHYPVYLQQNATNILVAQHKILTQFAAKGDCVVMGQSADVVLQEYNPFNMLVYADMPTKVKRCRERAPQEENLTDKNLIKKIKGVDAARAKSREIISDTKWGQKESYHLCVNTTGLQIKTLASHIADYAEFWLGNKKT